MCYDQEKTQAPQQLSDFDLREKMRAAKDAQCDVRENSAGSPSRPMSETEVLHELFTYHPPTSKTLPKFSAINQAAKNFAEVVLQNCPASADRAIVIRLIQDARMTANRAVALNGLAIY